MALVRCRECGQEVSTDAKACPKCGSVKYAGKPRPGKAIAGLVIVSLFAWCGVKACGSDPAPSTGSAKAEVASSAPTPAPWPGPAAWVADFRRLVKDPKAMKPYSTTRDDDGPLAIYDFKAFQEGAIGTMARVTGKPAAWRWQFAARGIGPTDLARSEDLEKLFETKTHETWYRVRAGELENLYVAFKPSYMPPQALLTVESAEYAAAVNEAGIQPWLCEQNRVPGKQGISSETMIARCQTMVREHLRSPSSANFQGLLDGLELPTYYGNCDVEWMSWVEAKNALGVELRTRFKCKYNAQSAKLRAWVEQ